jgi:N-acyl-D-aspartate/D-glutamate deacylase
MHDLVIRGAKLVDGTGAPQRTADIAVDGGVIRAVGRVGAGRRELDADGLLVTPGFVDIHTHYDAQVTWDERLSPSSDHGVTTVVMGNCGVGFAPVKPERRQWLIGLMEGVEDIPGAALTEGIDWQWESFPEYLDAIGSKRRACDFAAQLPHGALRAYVMGQRGADNEDASDDDIERMYQLTRDALNAGALGFSTSRTSLHKSIDGVPVPGTFAAEAELRGIARALGETNKGVFQLATDHHRVPEEQAWMIDLARETGRPVMFNLSQIDQDPELFRRGLAGIERAAAAGIPVFGQVAGRAIGIVMSWHATAHPFALRPSFIPLMTESPEARARALRDPALRAKILSEDSFVMGEFETFVTTAFDKMFRIDEAFDYEPAPNQSLAAMAAERGCSPQELAYDWLSEDDGRGMLYFPLFNYSDGDLDVLHGLHSHPSTIMGLSDAGAHCGAICDGGMPSFMLTHWTRDRKRGAKLPLEHVVRRQTSATAHSYGLFDRGVIAPGYKADINLIDYDALRLEKPRIIYDLPAGGRRLMQRASGYEATLLNGEIVTYQGEPTGALPGRLVRGEQPRVADPRTDPRADPPADGNG